MNASLIYQNYDLIFLSIIGISAIIAIIRGAITEILSLSSWFIALWLMYKFGYKINLLLPHVINNVLIRNISIYFLILIIVMIVLTILKTVITNIIEKIGLGNLNRLLGFIFGVIRGIFICALLILVIEITKIDNNQRWQQAKTFVIIQPILTIITNAFSQNIHQKSHFV